MAAIVKAFAEFEMGFLKLEKTFILAALVAVALAFAQAVASYTAPKPVEGGEFGTYFVEKDNAAAH